MIYLHLSALFALVVLAVCYRRINEIGKRMPAGYMQALIFGAALLLRLALACTAGGFDADTGCFVAWAERMWTVGPGNFYSPEVFTDYPPGFLYYLYLVGGLCHRLGIAAFSRQQLFLIRLPAVLADMACGGLIYREAERRTDRRKACILAAVYLYQPAIILNSAVWGQVDSILTLALAAMCLMLVRGKLPGAYIAFVLGVLLKPQMLVFAPVLLLGILDHVFLKDFSWKNLVYQLFCGLEALAGMAALCLPFGLGKVVKQYVSTLGEYPYAAVNSCNFWGLLGKNWVSQSEKFLFLSYQEWGGIAILAIVFFSLFIGLRRGQDSTKYPLIAAFVIVTMFLFSVRMHERYLYPGLAMLLLAYLYRPEKGLYLCYAGFSVLSFYNMAAVLFFYDPASYDREDTFILAVSAGMLLCGAYLYYLIACWFREPGDMRRKALGGGGWEDAFCAQREKRLKGMDFLMMAALTAVYACFALTDLGDRQAPATAYVISAGEELVLEFEEAPASFSYYIAPKHERSFRLEFREHGDAAWRQGQDVMLEDVFKWQEIELEFSGRQLRMILNEGQASILELCFRDSKGNPLVPFHAEQFSALFDEQALCPERSSFRNSMYFDEIYHGRTAYEYLHGLYSYENTHPPLGKIFIALGVAVFGMNPFGWRIVGTVFGILMVPAVYLFGKKFTGSTAAASMAGALFAFDFMHFVQTRIATIDVYITFFVILMYFFMYQYVSGTMQGRPWKKNLLPLGVCGICMGLGVACKWTGVYAGLGLAVIFFAVLYWQRRGMELRAFLSRTAKTAAFCILFFVCVPVLIYLLSYLPFVDGNHVGLLQRLLENQQSMFFYHSRLESTHAFSSPWYQWPVMERPVWYYSGVVSGNLREGISAFGNPLVWWAGIPASLYMLYRSIRRRDGKALFLLAGYMAQYLPWMFISRLTFIYHYFPSVVFIVLMIVYGLQCVTAHPRFCSGARARYLFPVCALICAAAAIGLFLLFYPVLSGAPVDIGFVDRWLRWKDGWVLISG